MTNQAAIPSANEHDKQFLRTAAPTPFLPPSSPGALQCSHTLARKVLNVFKGFLPSVIPVKNWFKNCRQGLQVFTRVIRSEVRAEPYIAEFAHLTRESLLQTIDWELKRSADAAKKFGVTAWTLLGGFAAVSWAFASMPELVPENFSETVLAFLLLELTLLFLERLWRASLSGARSPHERAASFSTLVGAAGKAETATQVLRFSMLFAAASFAPSLPKEIIRTVQVFAGLNVLVHAVFLVGLKIDVPMTFSEEFATSSYARSFSLGLARATLDIVPHFFTPAAVWVFAIASESLPSKSALRLAVMLCAASYLLRLLLVANAESRSTPFLEQLRRDVVFGFVSPPKAALQMARRLFGFPLETYFDARLRTLTDEAIRYGVLLWQDTGTLWEQAMRLGSLTPEERIKGAQETTKWFQSFPRWQNAKTLRKFAEILAFFTTAFAPANAKSRPSYLEWEQACNVLEAIGNDYLQAYNAVQRLVNAESQEA